MKSSDVEEEKSKICLIAKHQDDEVISQFSYHDLFRLGK